MLPTVYIWKAPLFLIFVISFNDNYFSNEKHATIITNKNFFFLSGNKHLDIYIICQKLRN